MGQDITLVSTDTTVPAARPTEGDGVLAWASSYPIGFLGLFAPEDMVTVEHQGTPTLTLCAVSSVAVSRLRARIPGMADRLAGALAALRDAMAARGRVGGDAPAPAVLAAELTALADRVASGPGGHAQLFLHDTYVTWGPAEQPWLTRVLAAADGDAAGWHAWLELTELANPTGRPWGRADVRGVTAGFPG